MEHKSLGTLTGAEWFISITGSAHNASGYHQDCAVMLCTVEVSFFEFLHCVKISTTLQRSLLYILKSNARNSSWHCKDNNVFEAQLSVPCNLLWTNGEFYFPRNFHPTIDFPSNNRAKVRHLHPDFSVQAGHMGRSVPRAFNYRLLATFTFSRGRHYL